MFITTNRNPLLLRNPTTISDVVMTIQEIQNEPHCGLVMLGAEINDNFKALQWCARRKLIRNSSTCDNCRQLCTLGKYTQGIDGYRWRCTLCNIIKSVRVNSIFYKSRLKIQQIITLICMWCNDFPQKLMASDSVVSKKCVIEWCCLMRNVCTQWLDNNYEGIGGIDENGESITVEIDELLFFHPKSHNGRYKEGHWVFGGIERESKKCFVVEVPDRKTKTLEACIKQNILPGTHIVSDSWAVYSNIEKIDMGVYQHSVVVPNDSFTHTKNVKNLGMRAKNKMKRQYGTDRKLYQSYLHEFMYRDYHRDKDLFTCFIITIIENY